jgi:hemerythrin
MSVQWTEDLRTGIVDIDEQHLELFRRFQALEDACLRQKGTDEIGRYSEFLVEYVTRHFAAEERTMEASGYPGLPAHREEHRQFTTEINALHNEIRSTGARMTLVHTMLWTSVEWLTDHVKGTDRKLAEFLKTGAGGVRAAT